MGWMERVSYIYDGISLQNQIPVNMDSLMIKKRRITEKDVCLSLVCDGVGSMRDGAFAAANAVYCMDRWFTGLEDTRRIGLKLKEATEEADRLISAESAAMKLRTASTFSALLIEADDVQARYYIVHVGDSRIFSYRDGLLKQLTIDQSRDGKLISYLGQPGGATLFYEEGDAANSLFLLCSDGLYKRMDMNFLSEELARSKPASLKKTIMSLTNYVIQKGERDNISVIMIMNRRDE